MTVARAVAKRATAPTQRLERSAQHWEMSQLIYINRLISFLLTDRAHFRLMARRQT